MSRKRVCVTVLMLLTSTMAWAAPKIELSVDVWDVGEIKQGSSHTNKIKINNTGDEPLVISKTKGSCSVCTGTVLDSKVVQPNEFTTLSVTFNAKRMRNKVSRTVTIFSNDPETPEKVLTVTALVKETPKPHMTLDPRSVDVGVMASGQYHKEKIKITNTGSADLTLKKAEFSTSKGLTVDIEGKDIVPPGESTHVVLKLGPFAKTGPIDEFTFIRSNDTASVGGLVKVRGYVTKETLASYVMIKPKGDAVALPNAKQKWYKEYEIANTASVPMTLEVDGTATIVQISADQKQISSVVLAPGESISIRVASLEELTEKNLRVTLEWPLTFTP